MAAIFIPRITKMARSVLRPNKTAKRVTFRSYDGLPAVIAYSNGRYRHEPAWYRNFLYSENRRADSTQRKISRRPAYSNFHFLKNRRC